MDFTINKIATGVVAIAMVAGLGFAFTATQAHATSLSELIELFIALEVIPADKADEARTVLEGQTEDTTSLATAMSCSFTRNLTTGDTGQDVMDLQKLLNAKGFTVSVTGAGSAGQESQYFGPATAAAVAKMQEMYAAEVLTPLGLTAGTGYFGTATRAKANMLCADEMPATPTDPSDEDEDEDNDSDMGGDEGSIVAITQASADESTLDEGQEGGVLGFDVEIEGDVMINRIDVYAEASDTTTASDNADDYFVRAFLMVDGDEVADIDVDDFRDDSYGKVTNGATNDDEYRLRFSGLELAFEDGDEPEFQVGFEMLSRMDSADVAGDWTVMVDSIRFEDGQGWTDSEDATGVEEEFGFGAEEAAELKITTSNSNPDSSVIKVDADTDETDDVTVFAFDIEEKNGIDVTINDLRVLVTTTGSTADEEVVVASAALMYDGEELDSASVPTGGVVTFENIDLDIDADDEVTLEVALTFEGTDGGTVYTNGQLVSVDFTSITDAEDANGNDESDMTISGTPNGEDHQLMSEGIYAEIVSTDYDKTDGDNAADDQVEFEIKFDVTAFEEDFYMGSTSASVVYHVELGGVTVATGTTAALSSTADEEATGNFVIEDGATETFTLSVNLDPDVTGFYRIVLDTVKYSAADDATLGDLSHTAAPAADFKTAQVSIDA
jgi:hypothetical protein